jgi:hypothetical protein
MDRLYTLETLGDRRSPRYPIKIDYLPVISLMAQRNPLRHDRVTRQAQREARAVLQPRGERQARLPSTKLPPPI